ncbi:MAG: hypothetical protein AAFZ65_06670 [Planctomycetota bacterium]
MQRQSFRRLALAALAAAAIAPLASAAPAPAPQELSVHVGTQVGPFTIGASYQKAGFRSYGGVRQRGFGRYGQRWVPGHWTVESQRIWQPGQSRQVWVQPVYATRYDECGVPYQVLVKAGYYKTIS